MNRKRANAMYRARCRALIFPLALLLVCSPPDLETSGSEITKMEHEFWVTLYHEVHPGEFPNWSKYGGRHAWAREETERLEPVVVQILRGEREETPWRHGLFVARDMPTERVCNALFTRMQSILREVAGRATGFTASDHASLVGVVSVLAEGGDARAVAPVNKLIQSPECSYRVAYKYLMALRKVGTAESLEALRRMPLRKSNERIDRMAAVLLEFVL